MLTWHADTCVYHVLITNYLLPISSEKIYVLKKLIQNNTTTIPWHLLAPYTTLKTEIIRKAK